MGAPQPVEKVAFACEAGICNPFFASALPRQKTLLSQQVCVLAALPPRRARGWDVRQKSPNGTFSPVSGAPLNRRTFLVIYIAYIHLTGYLLAPKRKHLKLTEAQALIKGIRGIELLAGAFLDGLDL